MAQLDQTQLSQIVSAVIQALQVQGTASAKPASQGNSNSLEAKDRSLVTGFKRKGIPVDQIKLMNRADPKAEYNIRPFKGWLEQGRMVKKGEKSIKGLFHVSQTSELPKATAKPAVPAAQQQLFE